MNRRPKVMSAENMKMATFIATRRADDLIRLAQRVSADSDQQARVEAHFCKSCFYPPRLVQHAMTSQACMCCGKDAIYPSTDTDALCMDCAQKHELCKHCGGDIGMRQRDGWPMPDAHVFD